MKRLILFRHAKSDWNSECETDHARPLAKRGRLAAALMGRFAASIGEIPDLVLTSSAERARRTAELAAKAGRWPSTVNATEALYHASPESVLDEIRRQRDSVDSLLLVGHEPTWSDLAARLIGSAQLRFPTAAMGRIDFAAETWKGVQFGEGVLMWLVTPKLLKAAGGQSENG